MTPQLELPLSDPPSTRSGPVARTRRVYVSRDLKLHHIDWIGFDMDYTLALYKQEALDRLSIDATVGKLVERGYPAFLKTLDYPLDFAIRGLLIDKKLGNILKMNRFKIVRKGYHGLQELDGATLRDLYYQKKVRHKSERFHWIDTLYGLSEACMYATIIEAFEKRNESIDYVKLFEGIRECIDEAHRDGSIKDIVREDPERFVIRDPSLAPALHKLRSAGKKLFVLTNSHWPYTKRVMSFLLDDAMPDYPSFQQYFDAVIVAARKPLFFQERPPFLEHTESGMVPQKGALKRGVVYQGGNIEALQKALKTTGDRVVYVGDHIYGDMLRSKKESAWRTAMVIQELEDEILATESCRDDFDSSDELYQRRAELEDKLRIVQQRLKRAEYGGTEQNDEVLRHKQTLAGIRRQLRDVDTMTSDLRRTIDRRYHPYWGSLLKERQELSLFGAQVSEYACVYTSRVSNLVHYSPHHYFRSPRGLMHHEL